MRAYSVYAARKCRSMNKQARSATELKADPFLTIRKQLLRYMHEAEAAVQQQQPFTPLTRRDVIKWLDTVESALALHVSHHPELPEETLSHYRQQLQAFQTEKPRILRAIQSGSISVTPNLSTPATQLAWGIASLHLHTNEKARHPWGREYISRETEFGSYKGKLLHESSFWKTLVQSPDAQAELDFYKTALLRQIPDRPIPVRWGNPDSHFYWDPREKLVNMDLLKSLIGGFEHTRAITLHEIGHADLSRQYSPTMQAIHQELIELEAKSKQQQNHLSEQDYLRMARLSKEWELRHDLWNSAEDNTVNAYAAEFRAFRRQFMADSVNYVRAALSDIHPDIPLPDPLPEWQFPETVQAAHHLFAQLSNIILLAFYAENHLFPNTLEGWHQTGIMPEHLRQFHKNADGQWEVKDHDWQAAFHRLMDWMVGSEGMTALRPTALDRLKGAAAYHSIAEALNDRRTSIIDNIWDQFAAPYAEILLQEHMQQVKQQMEQGGTPQQGKGGMQVDRPDGTSVPMPGISAPDAQLQPSPSSQQAKEASQAASQDGESEEQQMQKARQEAKKTQQSRQKSPVEPSDSSPPASEETPSIKKGDWGNYQEQISALAASIKRLQETLRTLAEKQKQPYTTLSDSDHTLIPLDSRFGERYSEERAREMEVKMRTGQSFTPDMLNHFRADEEQTTPITPKLLIWLDGSGSMSYSGSSSSSPIDYAVEGSVTLLEAAKRQSPAWPGFIYMFGDETPVNLARPDDNAFQMGEKIDGLRKGLAGSTYLAPTILKSIEDLAADRSQQSEVGAYTHIVLISDGDFMDAERSTKYLSILFESSPYVTLDIICISDSYSTPMIETWAESLQPKHSSQLIGFRKISDGSKIQETLHDIMAERAQLITPTLATDEQIIRLSLRQAAQRMHNEGVAA